MRRDLLTGRYHADSLCGNVACNSVHPIETSYQDTVQALSDVRTVVRRGDTCPDCARHGRRAHHSLPHHRRLRHHPSHHPPLCPVESTAERIDKDQS